MRIGCVVSQDTHPALSQDSFGQVYPNFHGGSGILRVCWILHSFAFWDTLRIDLRFAGVVRRFRAHFSKIKFRKSHFAFYGSITLTSTEVDRLLPQLGRKFCALKIDFALYGANWLDWAGGEFDFIRHFYTFIALCRLLMCSCV